MVCTCTTFDLSGLAPTELPITASLPLDGNGTAANPLVIDFTRLNATEVQEIATALCGDATAVANLQACLAGTETLTSLAFSAATGQLTYTDELGAATVVNVSDFVSGDAGNLLGVDANGLLTVPSSAFMASALAP